MTALATTTREAIATLLASTTSRVVNSPAPKVPIPPCLVVIPDSPWIQIDRVGNPKRYELRLKVLAVARDNDDGMAELEDAVEDILTTLATTCLVREVTPPQSTDIGAQGTVLVAEVKLSIQVKE